MLTPKQIEEARKQLGLNPNNPSTPTASTLIQRLESKQKKPFLEDAVDDFKSIGEGILRGAQKAGDKISAIQSDTTSSKLSKGFQTIGSLAGAGASAIGSTFQGAANMVLPETTEKKVTATIQKGLSKAMENPTVSFAVTKAQNWYDNLSDDAKKNVDAAGGIASLVSEFVGAGVGGKAASTAKRVASQGIDATVDATKRTGKAIGNAVGETVPSAGRIANHQITRALDLTQGDVKNISLSTGNEVGEFIADRNLIGRTKDETEKMIKDFYDVTYKEVREEIGKVNKPYSVFNVPRYTEALKAIQKQVDNTPGLQEISVEVENLLKKGKGEVSLNDVQRVKELMDDHFSLYKATGDVKDTAAKEGLANIRKELKEFIEKEVKDNTGVDIGVKNNEVATARGIADAIAERSTRGLTRSNIKLGDMGVFAGVSAVATPLVGAAAVFVKKVIESPGMQLKIARFFDKISDAKKLRIQKALEAGKVPDEIAKVVQSAPSSPKPQASKKNTTIASITGSKPQTDIKSSSLSTSKQIDINNLISHEGAPDKKQVAKYRKDIQAGKKLDPILVIKEGKKFGIEDGKHKYEAYKQLGYKKIPVVIISKA